MPTRIQLRRGDAAHWVSVNPVLGEGEVGLERDTGRAKIGDGDTAWNDLPYSLAPDPGVIELEDAETITTDASLGSTFRVAITDDRTLAAPTNPTDGQRCIWEVEAVGANRTLTLDESAGGFSFSSLVTEITETAEGTFDRIGAIYHEPSDTWHVVAYAKGFT